MYDDGNYRLYGTYKKCLIGRNVWNNLDEAGLQKEFSDFLKGVPKLRITRTLFQRIQTLKYLRCHCPGTMTTHAESINSGLQHGLDKRLRHTVH